MIHVFKSALVLNTGIDRAWEFFSDPRNLARITPHDLDFTVLTPDLPHQIYAGMLIEYRVRPLFGIPVRWLTEIAQVETGRFFVDEQRVGPYSMWHHEHRFDPLGPDQTAMEDRVAYRLPFPPLGDLAHRLLVRPQIENIFSFREKAVAEIFG